MTSLNWMRGTIPALSAAGAFACWLFLMHGHYLPMLTLVLHILVFGILIWPIWRWIRRKPWWLAVLLGAIAGLISSVVTLAVLTWNTWGASQFEARFFSQSVWFWPFFAAGWLFGGLVLGLLVVGKRTRASHPGTVQ